MIVTKSTSAVEITVCAYGWSFAEGSSSVTALVTNGSWARVSAMDRTRSAVASRMLFIVVT